MTVYFVLHGCVNFHLASELADFLNWINRGIDINAVRKSKIPPKNKTMISFLPRMSSGRKLIIVLFLGGILL